MRSDIRAMLEGMNISQAGHLPVVAAFLGSIEILNAFGLY